MSLWWSYVIDTDLFAVHPTKPKFVAVSKGFVEEDSEKGYDKHDQNRLFLFEGASPKPVSVLTINTPMKGIGFVPHKADRASSTKSKLMADPCSIIYLTGNQEFKFVRELSREDYEARLRNIQTEADNYQLTLVRTIAQFFIRTRTNGSGFRTKNHWPKVTLFTSSCTATKKSTITCDARLCSRLLSPHRR